jgi:hypothetical protein
MPSSQNRKVRLLGIITQQRKEASALQSQRPRMSASLNVSTSSLLQFTRPASLLHQHFILSFHGRSIQQCHPEAHLLSDCYTSTMSIVSSIRNTIQLAVLLASRACVTITDTIRSIKGSRSSSRSFRGTDSAQVWRAV